MDFKALKEAVTLERAAQWLGIKLIKDGDKYRCACPACERDRVLIITTSKGVYYCHHAKKGGDVTDLVAHCKGITQSAAAQLLQDQFMREPGRPKRQNSRSFKPKKVDEVRVAPEWEHWIGQLT